MGLMLAIDQGTTGSRRHRLRPDGRRRRARRHAGVPADLPAARLGRARPGGDLGDAARPSRARRSRSRGRGRRHRRRSASPTSARRPSLWDRATGAPVRQRHRLAGPAHGRPLRRGCSADGLETVRPRDAPACVHRRRTSPAPSSRWLLDHVPRRPRARASAASSRSAPSTRWLVWKLTGGRAHVTDPTNASRTHALRHPHARLGRRTCSTLLRRPARPCCPRCALVERVRPDRRPGAARRGDPDRRHRRRPAGRPVRPGRASSRGPWRRTPTARAAFMLHEHRPRAPSRSRHGLAHHGRLAASAARPTTPSRAACSSPARPSSGCATGSGSSATAADVEALAGVGAGHGRRLPRAGLRRARRAATGTPTRAAPSSA
ncbi:MAG: hypothetical protein MZU79_04650 [Anaerotruncus sp.]|nr:hypothetical protein [Anaerotruncus sp.]